VVAVRQPDCGQRISGPLAPLANLNPRIQEPVSDVLGRRLMLGEEELLEHEPDAAGAQRGELPVV
jgi:hypothetical protein